MKQIKPFQPRQSPPPRTQMLFVRVTAEERKLVETSAEMQGCNMSEIVRRALASQCACQKGR